MCTVEESTNSSVSLNLTYSQPGALPRQDSSSGSGKQESNRRDGGEGVSVSHKKNEDHHLHDVIEAVSTPKAFGNVRTLGKVSISFEFFFFGIYSIETLFHMYRICQERTVASAMPYVNKLQCWIDRTTNLVNRFVILWEKTKAPQLSILKTQYSTFHSALV